MLKQPAAPDKSTNSSGNSGVADAQIGKAQERIRQAQALMGKLREVKSRRASKAYARAHTSATRHHGHDARNEDGHDGRWSGNGQDESRQSKAKGNPNWWHDEYASDDG